jgi:hypothetical protein
MGLVRVKIEFEKWTGVENIVIEHLLHRAKVYTKEIHVG